MIRAAKAEDRAAIWALLEPVFRAGETYAVDRDIDRDAALAMWCDAPKATFVYEDAGEILGTYYIKTNHQGGGAHICNCGYIVGEAAQGQGLAAQMCEQSQVAARDLGYRDMQFNFVLASNVGAIHLWQKLGFMTLGRIPDAFNHPKLGFVDALVMHKHLL